MVIRQSGSLCAGLFGDSNFILLPLPHLQRRGLDGADDRLTALVHNDPLDPDHLRALAALPIQRLEQVGHAACEIGTVLPQLRRGIRVLVRQHGSTEALQRSEMHRDSLRCQHVLDLISWFERGQRGAHGGDTLRYGGGVEVGISATVAFSSTSLNFGPALPPMGLRPLRVAMVSCGGRSRLTVLPPGGRSVWGAPPGPCPLLHTFVPGVLWRRKLPGARAVLLRLGRDDVQGKDVIINIDTFFERPTALRSAFPQNSNHCAGNSGAGMGHRQMTA
jgi:hypothetical protein